MTYFDGIIHTKANFQDMQFKHKSWQIGKMSLSLILLFARSVLKQCNSKFHIHTNSSEMFPILVTTESHTVLLFFL